MRRSIGVLPDARGLYPRLTAREHIHYAGELHGLSGATLDKRIGELVELLDMKEIEHRRTEGFSQGERMKVALARALVHDPANIVLDEPTNGLDVLATRALMADFVNRGSVEGLSSKCGEGLKRPPFFTSFAGPVP